MLHQVCTLHSQKHGSKLLSLLFTATPHSVCVGLNRDEVICQLCNLKISKLTGIDNIPAKALKLSADVIGPSLTWIFNLSIKTGIYVYDWKKAWVLPIYKSDDRQKCENYRPISILPIISKILERSVFNQLYRFLNDNSLLSKYQSGF